jgi:hypothetical protein
MLGVITQGITLEHVCISALGIVTYMYTCSIDCDPVNNMTASRSSDAQTHIEHSRTIIQNGTTGESTRHHN